MNPKLLQKYDVEVKVARLVNLIDHEFGVKN